MKIIFGLILLSLTACAVYEPLPGLCYTDKTGTYICVADRPLKKKVPDAWTREDREHCSYFMGSDFYWTCMEHRLEWNKRNGLASP